MGLVRILFLSDTHLGFDHPYRPRIRRRRRGPDFFHNFERALEPAFRRQVDCVVHGGDILYRSRVPPELVHLAFDPLKKIADSGLPVFIVPGNHERSAIPFTLLAKHPRIFLFDRPRTFRLRRDGFTLSLAGFPSVRNGVRHAFPVLLDETGWRRVNADTHILCLHQAIEGAVVGPSNYVFRYDKDTIRASDIPENLAAVLSGHIHRHQVLKRDLRGRPFPAPVFYPGSIERTSFAEKDEKKGYLILALSTDGPRKGRLTNWRFHDLPTRPMLEVELDARRMRSDFEGSLRNALEELHSHSVVKLKIKGRLTRPQLQILSAPSIRSIAPPTMNVTVRRTDGTRKKGG
jgi:exonuclease SbcD